MLCASECVKCFMLVIAGVANIVLCASKCFMLCDSWCGKRFSLCLSECGNCFMLFL